MQLCHAAKSDQFHVLARRDAVFGIFESASGEFPVVVIGQGQVRELSESRGRRGDAVALLPLDAVPGC